MADPIWGEGPRYLTADVAPIAFGFRVELEDFQVEELPAYLPDGEGEHTFVHIEKRGIPTDQAARRLAQALGCAVRDVGAAGRKDARAVTRQWLSLPGVDPSAALDAEVEGLRVLAAARHGNKLRRGHLRGNRFQLRLRSLDAARDADVERVLERLVHDGLPNAYGAQRFGARQDNADLGATLYREGRAAHAAALGRPARKVPRHLRELHASALQARIFNRVLAARIQRGSLATVEVGDLAQKTDTGGVFLVEDAGEAARADRWEISATGPMPGHRTDLAVGRPGEDELGALAAEGLDLGSFGPEGAMPQRGTRRPLRVRPEGLERLREGADVLLSFTLPPGSYATALVAELAKGAALNVSSGEGPTEAPSSR